LRRNGRGQLGWLLGRSADQGPAAAGASGVVLEPLSVPPPRAHGVLADERRGHEDEP
jgi:hypothetical protein